MEGKIQFLVTTDVLAWGVDIKSLNLVLNYDIPMDMVSFIHWLGRTGWAGWEGKCITFFTKKDIIIVRKIVDLLKESNCKYPEWILDLKKENKSKIKKI